MNTFLQKTSKLNLYLLIFITYSLLATNDITHAAENTTVVLDIPGMTCQFCPITIRKALNNVDGVVKTISKFKTKTATVTFNSEKTDIETLIQATANAGYPSTLKINR